MFKCNKQHCIEVDNAENNLRKSNIESVTRSLNLFHMNKKQFQLHIFKKDSDVSLLELLQIVS